MASGTSKLTPRTRPAGRPTWSRAPSVSGTSFPAASAVLDRLTILVKQLELKLDVVIGEVPRNSEQKRYVTVTLGLTIDQPAPAM